MTQPLPRHEFLDQSHQMFLEGRIFAGMDDLTTGLRRAYEAWSRDEWFSFCREVCPRHPLHEMVQQDPFTGHSFRRPRGYPGDADLMDIIYQHAPLAPETTGVGRLVHQYGINTPASQSVRIRREVLAAAMDLAARDRAPRVLSVACGHLREAEFSRALGAGEIAVLTAFDQDARSLAEVERCYGALAVETVAGSVQDILNGSATFEDYDLIYSAGLYDYLTQPTARRLTARLFSFLAPGGTLLVANFLPSLRDIGYMEAFMNWPLIYRTAEEMMAVASTIPAPEIARQSCFNDPPGSVVFLEIQKA